MSTPRTLLELIKALAGWRADPDDPETGAMLTEIERRLTAARRYGGTEAAQIFSLLDTGEPISWVRDDEAPRLWFQGQDGILRDVDLAKENGS